MDFSVKLKQIRKMNCLSQSDLAKKLGVSYVSINRWENNKIIPSYKAQRKINAMCKKLGID